MRTGQALSLVHLRPPKGLEHDDTSRLPCKSTLSPLVFAQKNILQQKEKGSKYISENVHCIHWLMLIFAQRNKYI